MTKVLLVYATDAWHTHESKNLLGVAISIDTAVKMINEELKQRGDGELYGDDIAQLRAMKQTQTSESDFEGEFLLEEHEVKP